MSREPNGPDPFEPGSDPLLRERAERVEIGPFIEHGRKARRRLRMRRTGIVIE